MAMLNNQMVYHNDDNWLVVLNPSEKSESQLGLLLPIYGTIKNVPNHHQIMMIMIMISLYHHTHNS